jgi:rubrerythrin
MGEAARLYPSLPAPRNGELTHAPELLRGAYAHVEGAHGAVAGGAFRSLTINDATALIEKMVANQSWEEERKQQKGIHTVKEADMLAVKIDLLLKRLNERAHEKEAMKATVQATGSQMTCEVCGEVGHSGNDCSETREEASYINNGFQQGNNNGWNNQSHPQGGNSNFNSNYSSNQPSLKDLVLGQAKINESLTKKLTYNDKMLKNINTKIEGLSSSTKNQLSFNNMMKTIKYEFHSHMCFKNV